MRPTDENAPDIRRLMNLIEKLKPLHKKLGPPQPGDWLDVHDEPGETFREYLDSKPVTAHGGRRVIYIQPLGEFTKSQQAIVDATAEFLRAYFQLSVKMKEPWPESKVPARARRRHPHWGDEQILTTYVLHELLRPNLPDDAAAYLALTATDLWPGEGWNFVFGQASIRDHVGVWSIYRKGEPDGGDEDFRLCLLRTVKTASHEIGHMFSMHHCTAYECNMCGSNSVEEGDRRPLPLCPECLVKLLYATGAEPVRRFQQLIAFCEKHRLTDEQHLYKQSLEAISGR
jgi:archaemetzincin